MSDDMFRLAHARSSIASVIALDLRCSTATVYSYAKRLGLSITDPRRTGPVEMTVELEKMARELTVHSKNSSEPLEWDRPITVGDDMLLSRLRAVHSRPRDEVYPGSR